MLKFQAASAMAIIPLTTCTKQHEPKTRETADEGPRWAHNREQHGDKTPPESPGPVAINICQEPSEWEHLIDLFAESDFVARTMATQHDCVSSTGRRISAAQRLGEMENDLIRQIALAEPQDEVRMHFIAVLDRSLGKGIRNDDSGTRRLLYVAAKAEVREAIPTLVNNLRADKECSVCAMVSGERSAYQTPRQLLLSPRFREDAIPELLSCVEDPELPENHVADCLGILRRVAKWPRLEKLLSERRSTAKNPKLESHVEQLRANGGRKP